MDFAAFIQAYGRDVGFGVLVSFAVYLVFTGRLVPRSVVDQIRADKDTAIRQALEEKDAWKEAYQIESRGRAELGSQTGELLELAKAGNHMLQAIQEIQGRKTT